jgi:hypothetical protein
MGMNIDGEGIDRCLGSPMSAMPYAHAAYRAMATERDDFDIVKLEAPKTRRICIELRIMGLPTFLIVRGWRGDWSHHGPRTEFGAIEELDRTRPR